MIERPGIDARPSAREINEMDTSGRAETLATALDALAPAVLLQSSMLDRVGVPQND